jgi:hypothetical protein
MNEIIVKSNELLKNREDEWAKNIKEKIKKGGVLSAYEIEELFKFVKNQSALGSKKEQKEIITTSQEHNITKEQIIQMIEKIGRIADESTDPTRIDQCIETIEQAENRLEEIENYTDERLKQINYKKLYQELEKVLQTFGAKK